jgi:hypothetical protein
MVEILIAAKQTTPYVSEKALNGLFYGIIVWTTIK